MLTTARFNVVNCRGASNGDVGDLARFDLLWDVLCPQEKTRIVHVLVERVVYGGDEGGVESSFEHCILDSLAFYSLDIRRFG